MKNFFRNSRGTVLMEFVITLPLHLLVLLSVVYLGTLGTDRISVVSMENFSAFVTESSLAGLKDFYCPDDDFIAVSRTNAGSAPASSAYLYLSQYRVSAVRSLPVWLEGIAALSRVWLGLLDENNELLKSRTVTASGEAAGFSAALLKNPGYALDRASTADWETVANEPFVFGAAPAAVAAQPLSGYTRNSDCTTWSTEKI